MKKFLLGLLVWLIVAQTVNGQVGIGTTTPNAHAVLELKSPANNQGFMIPSLTSAQRTATSLTNSLGTGDNGLLVFDSDDNIFYYWNGIKWDPIAHGSGTGTVTNLNTGTGLTGGPISTSGTISLANTAVTAGTYGSATSVGQFIVDAQGRLTSAGNISISGVSPAGTASGDLGGSFPNPSVIKLQGSAVSSTAPTTNQVLKWNGTSWLPSPDANSGGTVTSVASGTGLTGGPITGTGTLSLANTAVTAGTYGSGTQVGQFIVDAQGRITSASNVTVTGAAPIGVAGGDLTGTYPNPTIGNNAVNATKMAAGDYSSKINSGTYSISITGSAASTTNFSGSLAGDVTGTQGATLVSKLQGSAVSSTAPTTNQVLKWSGTSWLPSSDANSGGTVTNVASGTGLTGGPITGAGTLSLANTAVTAGTYGTSTQVGQFIVDAQGRITSASNVTITGAAPTGAAGGDLTGSFPNPTIGTNAVNATKIAAGDYSTKINSGTYSISISGNATTATTATNFSGALTGDVTGTQGATLVSKLQGSAVSSTAPTTNQVLKWSGTSWLPSPDANSGGTVTSVVSGTGLTGGPITGTGTLSLANTAVTAGTYGTSTQVGQFIVDAQGRITSASNVTITGAAPTGGAGGDLGGNFPNPTVVNIQGSAVSSTAPTANQVLKWSGTSWLPSPDANSGGTVTSVASGTGLTGGPITGTGTLSLANTAVTAGTYGTSTQVGQFIVDAQGRITSASNVTITGAAPTGAAGGDLTGSYPNPTIGTNAVNATKIAAGDYSSKINSGTYAISVSGNAATATSATTATNFSGALAGDVTGTQGATLVSKLQGSAVSSTAPTANQVLKWSGTSWLPSSDANSGGTVTSVASGTGLTGGPITGTGTLSLANTAVTAGTYGTSTQVGQFIVDAQGRITSASNVTITGAAPTGAAGGDLTGSYPNPTIGTNAVNATKMAAGDYSTKINSGTYAISISGNATTATTTTNFSGALAGDVTGTQGATLVSKLQGSAVSSTAPTANQVLKWSGTSWLPSPDANSGGTVTSIASGTGLTGGPITGAGTLSLANTTVTAGTYGSATQVPQVIVDAQGRITTASNVPITSFSGALVGDVTGTQGATLVSKIQGNVVSTTAPTNNQVLKWSGTAWTPSADATGGLTLPFSATQASTSSLFSLTNTTTTAASAVITLTNKKGDGIFSVGASSYSGVYGANSGSNCTGQLGLASYGVFGYDGANNFGYLGSNQYGAFGQANDPAAIGVYGTNLSTKYASYGYLGATNYGVYGTNQNYAVYGVNSNTGESGYIGGQGNGVYGTGNTAGVSGATSNSGGYGVFGNNTSTTAAASGVFGTTGSPSGYGVTGSYNNSAATGGYGVYGTTNAAYSTAIYGHPTGSIGTGVRGDGYYGVVGSGVEYSLYGGGGVYGVYAYGSSYGGYFQGTTYAVYANGPAGGTTAWSGPSDFRFKKNIVTLTGSLQKVLNMRGVNFDWRSDEFPSKNFENKRQLGFIAQEVKDILPEIVSQDKDGYYSVAYDRTIPVLVEAIKEQQKIIDDQKAKIENLQKKEASTEERLATLEALLLKKNSDQLSLTAKKDEK